MYRVTPAFDLKAVYCSRPLLLSAVLYVDTGWLALCPSHRAAKNGARASARGGKSLALMHFSWARFCQPFLHAGLSDRRDSSQTQTRELPARPPA